MTTLSPAAVALVADIARNYGLRDLTTDENGVLRVDIDDQEIIIAFSQAWDSVVLTCVLAYAVDLSARGVFRAMALRGRFQGRTTRLAREPKSGALVLVAEFSLKGINYGAFSAAEKAFLADARLAQSELSLTSPDT